jgi:predicted dehydrogenase
LAVRNGKPAQPKIDDAMANMRVIEAVFESQRTGRFVELAAAC